MIYNWHDLSARDVLAVAIRCNVRVCCGSGLYHIARVSGHVYGEVMFCMCVVHLTIMFVTTTMLHV